MTFAMEFKKFSINTHDVFATYLHMYYLSSQLISVLMKDCSTRCDWFTFFCLGSLSVFLNSFKSAMSDKKESKISYRKIYFDGIDQSKF